MKQIKQTITTKDILVVEGNKYILDKNYDSLEVELTEIYGKYFGKVRDYKTNTEWDIMLNRLSKI